MSDPQPVPTHHSRASESSSSLGEEDVGESLPYEAVSPPARVKDDSTVAGQAERDRDFTLRIARWRESGDELQLRPIIDEFTRRIERQAARYTQRGLDQSDVMEAGYTALASTLKEFDTSAGVPFGVLFTRHFGAKVKEQRAQLEGAMALRRKTYQVRSNVLVARDAVRKEQASSVGTRPDGYTRNRDVERFSLPRSFGDAQFTALFDASGVGGEVTGPSEARAAAWAALFGAVADHYRRALPDAPIETLERAAIAKTVPVASAPSASRSAIERGLADAIDYDITMFARRGAAYDPAPSRERSTATTREFYEAVARRSGTTADRAKSLLESFGTTQSFDATPDDSGGKKVGPALGARLTAEAADTLDEDQIEPLVHGLHLVPTASRVAFVLHAGLDGFRPLPLPQLAHDCGITVGQAERLVDGAREVFANPVIRETIFASKAVTTAAATRAAVAETAARWHAEREAARIAAATVARTEDDAERVTDAPGAAAGLSTVVTVTPESESEAANERAAAGSGQMGLLF